MNLASLLIKKVLSDSDIETWGSLRRNYLPKTYHKLYSVIQKHLELYGKLPSFDDLKLSTRDGYLKEQLSSIEISPDVEIACDQLLDYLKNEYAQLEAMSMMEKFLDTSIATSTAEEIVELIQGMVLELETKIDVRDPEEDVRRISLFEKEEILEQSIKLGLNTGFDSYNMFGPGDYIMFGGRRGAGKSVTAANIAANAYRNGHSSIYFTIEMPSRSILQRICAIETGVPASAIRHRNLSVDEWERVAAWWSARFEGGEEDYHEYLKHHSFDELHQSLILKPLRKIQLDVVHDPGLTLARIRTELDKKVKTLEPKVVVVDYLNQVERGGRPSKIGQYDWTEQIEISKALKNMAQTYGVLMVSPYQIDATGEARFSKGILDAPDAAFTMNPHSKKDGIIEYNCTKMRNEDDEVSFVSTMNWATLKIGPDTGVIPGAEIDETKEKANDL